MVVLLQDALDPIRVINLIQVQVAQSKMSHLAVFRRHTLDKAQRIAHKVQGAAQQEIAARSRNPDLDRFGVGNG